MAAGPPLPRVMSSSSSSSSTPLTSLCVYFVKRVRRTCKHPAAKGVSWCTQHRKIIEKGEENRETKGERIPSFRGEKNKKKKTKEKKTKEKEEEEEECEEENTKMFPVLSNNHKWYKSREAILLSNMERAMKVKEMRVPAEWEPHLRCWMAWPIRGHLWERRMSSSTSLNKVRTIYALVAHAVAEMGEEPVFMVVHPQYVQEAMYYLEPHPRIWLYVLTHDNSWIRDNGPTYIQVNDTKKRMGAVVWRWNGYGELYSDYELDALVAQRTLETQKIPYIKAPIVFEGGALETDGQGTLLTTPQVVLDPARNPHLRGRAHAERIFRDFLGIRKVIWLEGTLYGDETKGHVDNLARFVSPGKVVTLITHDPTDRNYKALRHNYSILRSTRDAAGRLLDIIPIEQPNLSVCLPWSYLNFYIANRAVLMPCFGEEKFDERARVTLAKLFPDRLMVPIDSTALLYGGIHCITLQQPLVSTQM